MPKLTVLGGSSIAVPELIDALLPHMRGGRTLHVALHGRDAGKLELVGNVCRRMAASTLGLTVEATTDLAGALDGADIVLNQVRVGGLEARAYDETFPHRWNIPGEETVGPGGAANALRSIPVVLGLCQQIEKIAPNAVVLTFSNPSSVIQRAITRTTRLKVIGLCDAPDTMRKGVIRSLDVDGERVDTQYVGMHHFGWITSAEADGVERLPDVLADDAVLRALGIEPEIGRLIGAVPHPYFRYFYHPDRLLKKQRAAAQPRARELQRIEADLLKVYAEYSGQQKPEALAVRSAIWYEAVVAPVIAALAFHEPARLALNVENNGVVEGLAADVIIEVTAEIVDGVVRARKPRRLPPPLLAMLQANAVYEQLLVEAVLQNDPDLLVQAFLLSPLVPSYDAAREIAAEVWAQRGAMPQ